MSADPRGSFSARHIGTDASAQAEMLATLGYDSVDELVKAAVPASIHVRGRETTGIPPAATEAEALAASLCLPERV